MNIPWLAFISYVCIFNSLSFSVRHSINHCTRLFAAKFFRYAGKICSTLVHLARFTGFGLTSIYTRLSRTRMLFGGVFQICITVWWRTKWYTGVITIAWITLNGWKKTVIFSLIQCERDFSISAFLTDNSFIHGVPKMWNMDLFP